MFSIRTQNFLPLVFNFHWNTRLWLTTLFICSVCRSVAKLCMCCSRSSAYFLSSSSSSSSAYVSSPRPCCDISFPPSRPNSALEERSPHSKQSPCQKFREIILPEAGKGAEPKRASRESGSVYRTKRTVFASLERPTQRPTVVQQTCSTSLKYRMFSACWMHYANM